MSQKLTKRAAADLLGWHMTTLERHIESGDIKVEREPWGKSRHRIRVLLDDETVERVTREQGEASDVMEPSLDVAATRDQITIAVLEEKLAAAERQAEEYKNWFQQSESRYHELTRDMLDQVTERVTEMIAVQQVQRLALTPAAAESDEPASATKDRWWSRLARLWR